ncbi:hypothetical protein ACW69C_30360 [Streptomyces sp. MN3]
MESYGIRCTEDGQEHISAVAYGPKSVQVYVEELRAREGVSNVETFRVKPGE